MEQQDQVAELTGKKSRIQRSEALMRKLLIRINKSGAHGHGEVQGEGGIGPECFHDCHHAEGGEKQSLKKVTPLFPLMRQLFKDASN